MLEPIGAYARYLNSSTDDSKTENASSEDTLLSEHCSDNTSQKNKRKKERKTANLITTAEQVARSIAEALAHLGIAHIECLLLRPMHFCVVEI